MKTSSPTSWSTAALALALATSGCMGTPPSPVTVPVPSMTPPTLACSAAGVSASDASPLATVCVLTSLGEFVLALDATRAPITVPNFLGYVTRHFYDGTVIHRVEQAVLIQGGGYLADPRYAVALKKNTVPPIALESANGWSNLRGTIAMARTEVPDSATSQYFINLQDNPAFDYDPTQVDAGGAIIPNGYAVFGTVISGMGTADVIGHLDTYLDLWPSPEVVVYWAQLLHPAL